MLNPVLKNRRFLIIYSSAWLIIAVIHQAIPILYFSNYKIHNAIAEAIVFNGLYAVIGVGIWYPVYYTDLEKNKIVTFLTNHLAASSLAVGVWLWLSYVVLTSLFQYNTEYINYINYSLPWRVGLGFLFYLLITLNYYLLIYYQHFKDKLIRESELKALVKESQLTSLKSQINPHFLFNSLNSISSLTMISPEKAQDMVINLSDFLRYSISHSAEILTHLEDEMKNIHRYLNIEKIRFGKKLIIEEHIDDNCNKLKLPGLILQPIMENAIKYGVYESTDKSKINIRCRCNDELLEVVVSNDYDPDYQTKKGEGIGLRNVASRLKIQYGSEDLLKINKNENTFEIILRFPQKYF